MAIFYKHIKGCSENTQNTTSGKWTWIKWADALTSPSIKCAESMNPTSQNITDLGQIVTTNCDGLVMNQDLTFNWDHLIKGRYSNNPYTVVAMATDSNGKYISFGNNNTRNYLYGSTIGIIANSSLSLSATNSSLSLTGSTISITATAETNALLISGITSFSSNISITSNSTATSTTTGALKVAGGIGIGGNIFSGGSCNAVYFNATSDERAKEHINPYLINALDVIKNVEVKTFNYIDNKDKVIGIIAQDIQKYDSESFSFVANEKADGIDGNYMSIKESKLIYLLWKGIQEQQKEIEDLKLQIKQLKK